MINDFLHKRKTLVLNMTYDVVMFICEFEK